MAVVYESVQTTAFATKSSGGTVVIAKPTGLALNDFLVVHLSQVVASGSNADWNTPSGWTLLLNQNESGNANSEARLTVFYKIADSGDVAASNFTFTTNTAACLAGGALYRISGGSSITGAIDGETNTATPTFTNTVTPSFANSVMLFLATGASAAFTTGSVSGYAITTDNPTWTEVYDFSGSEGVVNGTNRQGVMAGAIASRPETTATGNSTCTFVSQTQNNVGAIVVIYPRVSANGNHTILTVNSEIFTHSISVGTTANHAILTQPHEIFNQNGKIEENRWTNTEKGTKAWTNQKK